jgi:hypothetical protein
MKRVLRYLRIAFSATCGLACVLLIVLWISSHWWNIGWSLALKDQSLEIDSCGGLLQIHSGPFEDPDWPELFSLHHPYDPIMDEQFLESVFNVDAHDKLPFTLRIAGLYAGRPRDGLDIFVSHLYPIAITAVTALVVWRRFSGRFSLRTLLIATTLVAVVLGLIVWAAR